MSTLFSLLAIVAFFDTASGLSCYSGGIYNNFVDKTGYRTSSFLPKVAEEDCIQCAITRFTSGKSGTYILYTCIKEGPSSCSTTEYANAGEYNTSLGRDEAITTSCTCCSSLCNSDELPCGSSASNHNSTSNNLIDCYTGAIYNNFVDPYGNKLTAQIYPSKDSGCNQCGSVQVITKLSGSYSTYSCVKGERSNCAATQYSSTSDVNSTTGLDQQTTITSTCCSPLCNYSPPDTNREVPSSQGNRTDLECYSGGMYDNFVDSNGNMIKLSMPLTKMTGCIQCLSVKVTTGKNGGYLAYSCAKEGATSCQPGQYSSSGGYITPAGKDTQTMFNCICCSSGCNSETGPCGLSLLRPQPTPSLPPTQAPQPLSSNIGSNRDGKTSSNNAVSPLFQLRFSDLIVINLAASFMSW